MTFFTTASKKIRVFTCDLADGALAQVYDSSTTRLYVGDMVFTRTGTSGTPVLESKTAVPLSSLTLAGNGPVPQWETGMTAPGSGMSFL